MTSLVNKQFVLVIFASLLAAGVAAEAQETDLSPVLVPTTPDAGPAIPGVSDPGVPDPPPTWQYERTTTNQAGTVRNTHRNMSSGDPAQGTEQYQRQHVVTNPRGEMVQSWERSQAPEGYQYRRAHTFTAPDGTLLKQQEWTRTGTDPYNYTRERQHQLRDGRTIMHRQTRSWDGTTGTMEKSFTGPNGQTRDFLRPWAPDEQVAPQPGPIVPETPTTATAPVEQPKKNRWGWMEKLNPFRKGGPFRPAKPAPQRRSGFTIGSGAASSTGRMQHGLNKKQPGNPSPNSRRPSWAGPNSGSPPGHLKSSASRPLARGKNR